MNNKDERWLYLMSSNATKEYIIDILEVLSLPYGSVQHFRYQLRWLDKELRSKLPIKDKNRSSKLKNRRVVICYLYQEESDSEWRWIAVYPIRSGILMDAYKTGDKDEDVSHFYFKVDNYISYDRQDFNKTFSKHIKCGKVYALLDTVLNDTYIVNKEDSKSAFHKICNSLDSKHLKLPGGNEYFPIYCFIDGLKDKKGKLLAPKYDPVAHKSFYELTEGGYYSFEFGTYFTSRPPQYVLKLLSDEKVLSTPPLYELEASSRYDEESWVIVSRLLERDTWTFFSFKTELPDKVDNRESLNIHLKFPTKIKRKILYRIFDAASDLGFGVGTAAIAYKAAFPSLEMPWWWYWLVIGGYALWGICKIIIKLWRG